MSDFKFKAGDNPLVYTLSVVMSNISEESYCAGWIGGLEYSLWRMLAEPGSSRNFGLSEISDADIASLRTLSDLIDGWVMFNESGDCDYIYVPMAEWLVKVEQEKVRVAEMRREFDLLASG